jgi:integrase
VEIVERKPTLRGTDGRYMLMVRVKPGPKGREPVYGATVSECQENARKKLAELEESSPALPSFPPESFGWFLYNVWVPHVYPGLRKASRRKYDTLVVHHLLPALAYTPIAEIGYGQAKAMRDGLTRKDGPKESRGTLPLPDRQKAEVIYRFREIMGLYRRLKIAETALPVRDDWALVEAPAKPEKKVRRTPGSQYIAALYGACDAKEKGLVFAAYGLMLRRAEISGFMKRHIDRKSLTLTISEQMPERGGENEVTKGKPRVLPITRELLAELDALSDPNSVYVFTDHKGRPWKPDAISKLLPKIVRRAGLTHSTPHDLRSYAASDSLSVDHEAGVTVKDLMGHTQLQTTMIYVNTPEAPRREALGKLQKRLTNPQTQVESSLETTG